MTRFQSRGPGVTALTEDAVRDALIDASINASQVQHVYFGNAAAGLLQGQEMIRGQVLLRDTGLLGSTIVNVENACSSSSTAFFLAVNAVASGQVDIAMAVGVEQLVVANKSRSFAALASATDTIRRVEMRNLVHHLAFGDDVGDDVPSTTPLMAHYANKGSEYLARTAATVRDFALVVEKSRHFGSLNPFAHFQKPLRVDETLLSRMVSEPLTLPMCSALSNGAAAVIVVSEAKARQLGATGLVVRATSVLSNNPESMVTPTTAAGAAAFERAGLGPQDIDFAEVHDAAAPAELIIMEELGLASEGTAFELLRRGESSLGGRRPINPSGGLLSRGHPIGATGCAQIVELSTQLRDRAGARQVPEARIGLAQNGGGVLEGDEATVSVSILERT